MSFWPFGQQTNSASNLKRLLGLYYDKRSTEALNHQQQQQEQQTLLLQEQQTHGATQQPLSSTVSQLQQQQQQHVKEREYDSFVNASDEQLDEQRSSDDVALNKGFLWTVLDDPSLLNELKQQNNKLVDFICFGYINADAGATEKDSDGDIDLVSDDAKSANEDASDRDDNSSVTIKHPGSMLNSVSIMEVLVDLIIDSFGWFEQNEKLLLQSSNDDFDQANDEELDTVDELNKELNRIHVASEILSSNIWLISETLVEDQMLLSKLWRFLSFDLKNSSPTIPLFVKINERLLESRPDQLLNFIRAQPDLVDSFIKHIDITIIMDLLLRTITTDKPDIPTGIIDILSEQQLIEKLLNILKSETDSSTQSSCGDFLKALISLSANTSIDENTLGPNQLIKQLVGEHSIEQMIQIILNRGNGLSTVVGVIIEIIRKNNSDYDSVNLLYTTLESHPPSKRDPIYLGAMLNKFSESLSKFNDILFNEENTSKRIKNQINQEIEPLGFERFKICELIAELLHCSNIGLLNNHLTEKIIEEREKSLLQQEDNLANALNDEILEDYNTKANQALNISNLNIGGASEPSVAVSSRNITISPIMNPNDSLPKGEMPLNDDLLTNHEFGESSNELKLEISKGEQIRSNPTVGDKFKIDLVDSKILQNIITMFTNFPWNNFWHNVVFDLVQQIFNGRIDIGYNSYLILELFEHCDITNLIIKAYELCVKTEEEINVRLGYMGHLVLIAEEVVKFSSVFQSQKLNDSESDELIYNKLVDDDWINYVTNVLTETREQYNGVLGGIKTQEFEQSDYLNSNAIVLGQTEEEILNQPIGEDEDDDSEDVFYESKRHQDEQEDDDDDDKSGSIDEGDENLVPGDHGDVTN
jgi:hypothetical protein